MKNRMKKIGGLMLTALFVMQAMVTPALAEEVNSNDQQQLNINEYYMEGTEDLAGIDDVQIDLDMSMELSDMNSLGAEEIAPVDVGSEGDGEEVIVGEDPVQNLPSIDEIEVEKTQRMQYDDRLQLANTGSYIGYRIQGVIPETVTSYQVKSGAKQNKLDEAVVIPLSESEVIASGVGSAIVALEKIDDTTQKKYIRVQVEPAKLTIMFLAGQSNAEGMCSANIPYQEQRGQSIACKNGEVYATYAPTTSRSDSVAGISYSQYCTASNVNDYVPGALGQHGSELSISGKELQGKLEMLTEEGDGKTGPDSALAYTWNKKTGDKVWVVNGSWGATSITAWMPDGNMYKRSMAIYKAAMNTYVAEILAGHYQPGRQLMFWLQGEADYKLSTAEYKADFNLMYKSMWAELNKTTSAISNGAMDGMGIIMVRSAVGNYHNDDEIRMTGPRIAQYAIGASKDMSDVYVVSNVNEQWVSDQGVENYFASTYPGGKLNYPMQGFGAISVPTTVDEVHYDIHYSQIGHNENGLTAAEGMYQALLAKKRSPQSVSWKDVTGKSPSEVYLALDAPEVLVPVVTPTYTAKQVSYRTTSTSLYGGSAKFDSELYTITGSRPGIVNMMSSNGSTALGTLTVTITNTHDFTDVPGVGPEYNGFYYSQGSWYYLQNGVAITEDAVVQDVDCRINENQDYWYVHEGRAQLDYTYVMKCTVDDINDWWYFHNGRVDRSNSVGQNEYGWWKITNGRVDRSFNGFARNENGDWYIKNGKVQTSVIDVIKDKNNDLGIPGAWYYVKYGQVTYTDTVAKNSLGWWRIENGRVNFSCNSVERNESGWWYIRNGQVDFTYTGVAKNSLGWWRIENGKVNFNCNSVERNEQGWWYIRNGQVDFNYTGVAKNNLGWWRIENGKVNFGYNGLAKNEQGWWYIRDGKVDFSYTGYATYAGVPYRVVKGQVVS